MKLYQLILLCGTIGVIVVEATDYTNCHKSLIVLERALFETEGNLQNLSKIFFPPRKLPTAFVRVNYHFLDELGDEMNENNCTVKYVWALGGFLLVQPPKVFRFTSLFFNNKVDDLNDLTLTLPFECREIVTNSSTETCSCKDEDKNLLDVLTQQVIFFVMVFKQYQLSISFQDMDKIQA